MTKTKSRVKHIAFTCYPVKDMARARKFYEEGLGLEVGKDFRGEWIEYYLDNGAFCLTTMMKNAEPARGAHIAFEVDDIDSVFSKLKAVGAGVKYEPFDTPVCRIAVLIDPEGNSLAIHQKKA